MSIIIPSNKVYKQKKDVINKNKIGSIEFNYNQNKTIQESSVVYKENHDISQEWTFPEVTSLGGGETPISAYPNYDKIEQDLKVQYFTIGGMSREFGVFSAIIPYYKTFEILLDKKMSDLFLTDNTFKLECRKTVRHIYSALEIIPNKGVQTLNQGYIWYDTIYDQDAYEKYGYVDEQIEVLSLPMQANSNYSVKDGSTVIKILSSTAKIDEQDTFNIVFDSVTQKYKLTAKILCGVILMNAYGSLQGRNDFPEGSVEEYRPISVSLNIYNDAVSFSSEEIKTDIVSSAQTNDVVFSLSKSALMQSSNADAVKQKLSSLIESYANGKETATLLCSVGDYYDENGNRVVSTETADKMTFNLYDEVLPLYRTPMGDAPMSMADGKPKIFKVLGSKVYFDGAVWQEISLQESGTTDYIVQNGTRGLFYALREDGGSYYCAGIGNATESEISIASIANGVPVTSVGSEAFRDNQQIKSAIIPNGISRINGWAFFQSGLLSAELPDTLQYIGDVAFAESQLTKIEIPQSVSQIGLGAFNNCHNLNTAIIKANIDKIEDAAFSDCHNLRTVKFPSSVKKIGKMSFMNAAFDSIELGNVQEIVESAFRNCLNLKNVSLNKCVDIGDYAFANCGKMKALSLNKNGVRVGKSAFSEIGIESLTIPDNILSVGQQAFANCPNLKSVTIENGVNIALIDYTVFEGSPIENATSHIDTILLIPTTHLKKYTISGGETIASGIFTKYTALENVIIGNTVKTIGNSAFYYCSSLTRVTMTDSVTSIGDYAFSYCYRLASVTIGNGVTSIGNSAFEACYSLTDATIPDSVASIGERAFSGCSKLTSVTIGNGVTSIGSSAFSGAGLTEIVIPPNVKTIGTRAFYKCEGIETVTIEEGLTSINRSMFSDCHSLRIVTIPESVTFIDVYAFMDCPITDVYYNGSEEQWNSIEIKNDYSSNASIINATIHFAK